MTDLIAGSIDDDRLSDPAEVPQRLEIGHNTDCRVQSLAAPLRELEARFETKVSATSVHPHPIFIGGGEFTSGPGTQCPPNGQSDQNHPNISKPQLGGTR
jgi:hypothetical protein